MSDSWNPMQYALFQKERDQPFDDLVNMIHPNHPFTILDLGCGTGRLTSKLHAALKADYTLGIDASESMLNQSRQYATSTLHFKKECIEQFIPNQKFSLLFSNAALQWIPNHKKLFPKLVESLSDNGQIAFQVPANQSYQTHALAREIISSQPFKEHFTGENLPVILTPEEYSEILYELGFKQQLIIEKIYPLTLNRVEDLIEWVKGSLLTYYQSHLTPQLFEQFLEAYTTQLKDRVGEKSPCFVPFKRLFIWGSVEK